MRVCLLTTGQPATNPRLVKEADALSEAGYLVYALCTHWVGWGDQYDRELLASRRWSCQYVAGHPHNAPLLYALTRLRHGLSRRLVQFLLYSPWLKQWALWRAGPELERAAKRVRADLYIAHNLGALPAAWAAAEAHGACLGFDAEDFHSGSRPYAAPSSVVDELIDEIEWRFLPRCHYITAASPGIGEAYSARYTISQPIPILNVFPLSQRPLALRPSRHDGVLTLYWFSQTIGAERGLEDVVKAMGLLRDYRIELHLRGQWSPGYRDHLFQYAASVGVNPTQIIVHNPAAPDEMVRLATQYDVGLALEYPTSLNRIICQTNKIFAYLLAGVAVVATDTVGQRSIMAVVQQAGFSYTPGDIACLTDGLRDWYMHPDALYAAREEAWQWGTRRYNWEIEKQRFLAVVARTLSDFYGDDTRLPVSIQATCVHC